MNEPHNANVRHNRKALHITEIVMNSSENGNVLCENRPRKNALNERETDEKRELNNFYASRLVWSLNWVSHLTPRLMESLAMV